METTPIEPQRSDIPPSQGKCSNYSVAPYLSSFYLFLCITLGVGAF